MAETITIGADGKAHINWLGGADPSWYGRVLGILHRDYPDIETQVWSTAIGENAAGQVAKKGKLAAATGGGDPPDQPLTAGRLLSEPGLIQRIADPAIRDRLSADGKLAGTDD